MDLFVKHNVALMTSAARGGMQRLLAEESIGGNASAWQRLPCAAANFSFDSRTGAIAWFDNPQDVPGKYRRPPYIVGTFRVAVDLRNGAKTHIVEFICHEDDKAPFYHPRRIIDRPVQKHTISSDVRRVIDWSMREYNQVHGF
jgi:hypothetical protein